MNSFITLPIDLSRTATALENIGSLLSRIADALDRLAPPVLPVHSQAPIQTQLNELHSPTPEYVSGIKQELDQFASQQNVVPGSDAFYLAVQQFESEVADVYGEKAISELPWNKLAGGPIFKSQTQGSTDPKQKAGKEGTGEASNSVQEKTSNV